jgi:hypothetical protein
VRASDVRFENAAEDDDEDDNENPNKVDSKGS